MGIQGLLPLLKSIQRPTELKKFSGEVLGVDAYGWLHRGTVACAIELAQGKPTRKYVEFAMHRVRMVKYFGATPYLVFDGDFLPSKAKTEESRAKRREESRKAGLELLKAGKPAQAYQELQKSIDVTPEMARQLIEELKKAGIPYLVAPYEADAQLVYLERQGIIDGIISEDSDMLVFGAKRLLTKLDQHGECIEINRKDFCACREISLTGWTDDQFRQMAIFSGCDYLEGINNMGLKTAYRMLRKHKTPERVVRMLQFEGKFRVSGDYLAQYKQAELTFLYQRVYCPKKQRLVLLTEPDPTSALDIEEMPYIGADLDAELAQSIAVGDVNPITKEPIIVAPLPEKRRSSTAASSAAPPAAPAQERPPLSKPIDSYFKGHKRIPLGEMDRNCFAVEPKQVAALTQNGLTPRVFPLPRPYLEDTSQAASRPRPYATPALRRRRTEPISRTLSDLDPSIGSTTSRRQTAGVIRKSPDKHQRRSLGCDTRPSKKARLCQDAPVDELLAKPVEKSKYFSASTKVTTKSDAYLLSEDSIEDVLANFPDPGDWDSAKSSKGGRALAIFQDNRDGETEQSGFEAGEESKTKDDEVVPESPPMCRRSSISGRDAIHDSSTNKADLSETQLHETVKQFSYTPNAARAGNGTRMAYGLPTPASSAQGSTSKPAPSSATSITPFRTPLQRIGAQALQRGNVGLSPLAKAQQPHAKPKPKKKRSSLEQAMASLPVNPALVPLPRVDLAEVEALNKAEGSEDQLIPDSDEENVPQSPGSEPGRGAVGSRRLDLSRFLYA